VFSGIESAAAAADAGPASAGCAARDGGILAGRNMETHLPHRSSKSPRATRPRMPTVRRSCSSARPRLDPGGSRSRSVWDLPIPVGPSRQYPVQPHGCYDSQIPPQPRIQEHPAVQIQQLHAYEDQALSTYVGSTRRKALCASPLIAPWNSNSARIPVGQEAYEECYKIPNHLRLPSPGALQ